MPNASKNGGKTKLEVNESEQNIYNTKQTTNSQIVTKCIQNAQKKCTLITFKKVETLSIWQSQHSKEE